MRASTASGLPESARISSRREAARGYSLDGDPPRGKKTEALRPLWRRCLNQGVINTSIDGVPIRVYSLAKTITDCLKYRKRLRPDLAQQALEASTLRKDLSCRETGPGSELFSASSCCYIQLRFSREGASEAQHDQSELRGHLC